ncbi:hypothetical protein GCM10010412_008610 [Nonomuraea recticatena]|uniref:Uncharacterized protein n=1 Tax=Nonomuraea recticatena TaxID=46178 RepID=A0ABN3R858_9ACTN
MPQGGRDLLRIHIYEPAARLPSGEGQGPRRHTWSAPRARDAAQPPQAAKTNVSFSIE